MIITEQVFLGGGDHSLAQIGRLYQALGQAISELGVVQQPPNPCDPTSVDHRDVVDQSEYSVRLLAREIYIGLTGEKPWR